MSYNLYRGTFSYFAPGTPWQTVAALDTTYDFSEGVGDQGALVQKVPGELSKPARWTLDSWSRIWALSTEVL
ncbi:hypothetical protein JXA88_13255 [Candidatus Fermentibacteria bacterium]|nr:hypothetical protein [Candidatus Fermentibacteria bacterium]